MSDADDAARSRNPGGRASTGSRASSCDGCNANSGGNSNTHDAAEDLASATPRGGGPGGHSHTHLHSGGGASRVVIRAPTIPLVVGAGVGQEPGGGEGLLLMYARWSKLEKDLLHRCGGRGNAC